jgi:tripartite-type tricarboxylate transporter receptor subunit TctC
MLAAGAARAQDYPARPIQVIVPFAGGSASDVVTRIMLDRMARTLGQPFIVDNRPGAGGNTGTQAAARTAPDGYTLVMSTVGPLAANRTLFKSLGYDPEKDFRADLAVRDPAQCGRDQFQAAAEDAERARRLCEAAPKELNYGSVGVGSRSTSPAPISTGRGRPDSSTCRIATSRSTRPTSSPDRCRSASSSCPTCSAC